MFSQIAAKIAKLLLRVEECVLSAAVLVIAGLTIVNVGCRSMLNFSLAFAGEVSQFCIIVICFVGLSYAASQGRHIRMTALYDLLPLRARKAFMLGITFSTAALMFVLTWYACLYVRTVYELNGIFPALRIPFYIVYAIAPLGLFLAGIQYSLAAVRNLISPGVYISFDKRDEYEAPVAQEI